MVGSLSWRNVGLSALMTVEYTALIWADSYADNAGKATRLAGRMLLLQKSEFWGKKAYYLHEKEVNHVSTGSY